MNNIKQRESRISDRALLAPRIERQREIVYEADAMIKKLEKYRKYGTSYVNTDKCLAAIESMLEFHNNTKKRLRESEEELFSELFREKRKAVKR